MLENFTKLNVGKKNQLVNEKTKQQHVIFCEQFQGSVFSFQQNKRNRRIDTLVFYCTAVFRQENSNESPGGIVDGYDWYDLLNMYTVLENYVWFFFETTGIDSEGHDIS